MHRWISTMTAPIFFIGAHCSILFIAYPRAILATTSYGHWEPATVIMLIELALMLILMKGLRKGGNLDYGDMFLPLGRWVSTALLLPLICYFMLVPILAVRSFAELMVIVFVANSPMYAILALLCLLSWLGASIGPYGIMRASTLMTLIYLPVLLFALLACLTNTSWLQIQPLLNPHLHYLMEKKFLTTLFSICPFLFLGMLPPVCKVRIKPMLLVWALISLLYVFIVYLPILVYGVNAAKLMNFPLMTSLDTVNITWSIFDRVSLFYAVALLAFVIMISSFSLWSCGLLLHKLVPVCKESYFRGGLCLIVYVAAMLIPTWERYVEIFSADTWLRMAVFVVIPIAVYLRGKRIERQGRRQVGLE
ncbi:GerAB/ArcD/ProY family transporter [Paenibacillus ferrarius]|uniref:GerAB/ArcD/ProY family transporter n=1 Tax=Paenibacillus ferrarius TaxID=1469647 RepID=UPI003D27E309